VRQVVFMPRIVGESLQAVPGARIVAGAGRSVTIGKRRYVRRWPARPRARARPVRPASVDDDRADRLAALHQLEAAVDVVERPGGA
jgi:hypothetical protein